MTLFSELIGHPHDIETASKHVSFALRSLEYIKNIKKNQNVDSPQLQKENS